MVTTGLMVRFEARTDRVAEVEATLAGAAEHVREEGLAVAWAALRIGPRAYAVLDVFESDADREAHLAANAPALKAAGVELFVDEPTFEVIDVVASVLPGDRAGRSATTTTREQA